MSDYKFYYQVPVGTMEGMLLEKKELQAQLSEAIAQRDAATNAVAREYWREDGHPLPTDEQAQRIRTAACEEAARRVETQPNAPNTNVGLRQQWVREQAAAAIRALAPLPSTHVLVPRETVAEVREALVTYLCAGHKDSRRVASVHAKAAIALLAEVDK